MKTKLLNVLSSCTKNKSFNDFNLLLTIQNYLKLDETSFTSITELYDQVRITLNGVDYMLIITFYDNNDIGLTLPYSGLFLIPNCPYNMQYDEIKSLLLN